MAHRHRMMDPELAALQVLAPRITLDDVAAARVLETTLAEQTRDQPVGVRTRQVTATRRDGSPLSLRLYRPEGHEGRILPVLVFLHGGSFVTGGLHSEDNRCEFYAREAGCAVVAVDYRLAPEHPFPAGFDDCCDALDWVAGHAGDLGVDPDRMAVGGLSAGGCLAAGVALRSRTSGPPLLLQMLLFPVLDARLRTGSVAEFEDTPILIARTVRQLWPLYLGELYPLVGAGGWSGSDGPAGASESGGHAAGSGATGEDGRANVYGAAVGAGAGVGVAAGANGHPFAGAFPPLASPALVEDLSGAPPALVVAAQFDPLRDEAIEYAGRLLSAGVAVDLVHFARGFHAFDSFGASRLGRRCLDLQAGALRQALV
ncbi:alpha/beta hydrolase fold domain-containing protein [Nakamurella sp. YIM 132087]|uniref:Alpha/beta hydrolase fold domain-containing protein n=1 Tax=Nakamurella alba TaxID=2665158 RepID=A0A7K1FUI3_9ACTN|nr:alpha/beta hydrolase [Nakamurella alba]MTD16863.1 alpha/beta hydrolase fold domain-containing protein [Nakamurella alba]